MQTLLLVLIVLLSGAICAVAGYWIYHATRERRQGAGATQFAPQSGYHSARNQAWDRAVRAARNRNW